MRVSFLPEDCETATQLQLKRKFCQVYAHAIRPPGTYHLRMLQRLHYTLTTAIMPLVCNFAKSIELSTLLIDIISGCLPTIFRN